MDHVFNTFATGIKTINFPFVALDQRRMYVATDFHSETATMIGLMKLTRDSYLWQYLHANQ